MIKLAVGVMAHAKREDRIPGILAQLGSAAGEVFVSIDREGVGPWLNAKRCWEAAPPEATHMLVLQDDVVLCRDFYVSATRAIKARPNCAISFYANDRRVDKAREDGKAWAKIPGSHHTGGVWGQAQCIPTKLIEPLISWWKARPEEDITPGEGVRKPWLFHDDWILGKFLHAHKIEVWATVPSLVEHDCPSASLIGYGNKSKVARWFIGTDVSALTINWRH